ncbi:MAG: FtsX-like permease family protein, partial [Acidobacteria bacterium]
MSVATYLRHLRREVRGSASRLVLFVLCLAVGVAAVVAVKSLSDGLERGIRGEARQLLAADLAVRGRSPIPGAVRDAAARPGVEQAEVRELLTVVAAPGNAGRPGRSQLVELKAVSGGYPFYGELELAPPAPLDHLLDERSAVVAPDLLARLGLAVGEELKIGGEVFRIAGTVLREPDRIATAMSGGPRVFVSLGGLARADLIQRGSRVTYRLLLRLPEDGAETLAAFEERLRQALPEDGRFRLETYRDAQPTLRRGLRRLDRFLGLAALLSLLIGGIGVAQTVRAWLTGRLDAIAVLKCLGYRPRQVLALYLGQALLLALAGSTAGVLLGVVLSRLPVYLLAGLVPVGLVDPWQPAALGRGFGLGLGVALLFSAPPLLDARRVPPIRVLRRTAEPLAPKRAVRLLRAGLIAAGVFALASWQARSVLYGAQFTAALGATALALVVAARALVRLAQRPRRRARLVLRHGLAALGRPGAATGGAVVALGLGVLVLVGMLLVQRRLHAQLDRDLPADAPSAFLIDVQPDQWPGVEALLRDAGAERLDSVPVVTARLRRIDGQSIAELTAATGPPADPERARRDAGRRWALTREQRLTYLERLPDDNAVVEGALWQRDDLAEISVERSFARDLGVGVGSRLAFDVQGVPLELTVTSIRTVEWESFGINFFLVVEPGVLEGAPQHRVVAARLPRGREQAVQDRLAASFPNVTMIRIRDVLERLGLVLGKLELAVAALGVLVLLAGLLILAGAIGAGAVRRGAEVALYKTLGMTRRQVVAAFATEYALVGLVAGLLGTAGGALVAWLVTRRGMDLPWSFDPLPLALAPLA